jgi:SAM-dependent methyltransferase
VTATHVLGAAAALALLASDAPADVGPWRAAAMARRAQAIASLQTPASARVPDSPFIPSSPSIVDAMLTLANVKPRDVVYDLGCGDGRVVIAAAKKYGARGVGIDVDPRRIREAIDNARAAGVMDKVRFVEADMFHAEISDATVVVLYLGDDLNLRLQPKLLSELKPGTRVVSHEYDMGDWMPKRTRRVEGGRLLLWTVPPRSRRAS